MEREFPNINGAEYNLKPIHVETNGVNGVHGVTNGHASPYSPRWCHKLVIESEDWFSHKTPENDPRPKSSRRRILREEGRKNMEKVAGGNEDWFEHVTNGFSSSSPTAVPSIGSPKAVKYRELNPNSKEWYRHEHKRNETISRKPVNDNESDVIADANELNVARILTDSEVAETDESAANRRQAEYYRRRNLMGSPAEWYAHEHDDRRSAKPSSPSATSPEQTENGPNEAEKSPRTGLIMTERRLSASPEHQHEISSKIDRRIRHV